MDTKRDTYLIRVRIEKLPEGVLLATSGDFPGLIVQSPTRKEPNELVPRVAHELIMSYSDEGDALPTALLARSVAVLPEDEIAAYYGSL